MNRREFLSALSVGTAHLLFSPRVMASTPLSIDPFQFIKLGSSGLETSLLGFGTGVKGFQRESFLTRQDPQESLSMLLYAYELGCRFFDTADLYGTHELVGNALQSMERDQVTLSSKIWFRKGGLPEEERLDADVLVDRFRRELKTDYIDLVQLHCATKADWTDSLKRQMDILDKLKSRGIIRAHGVSVHSLDAMQAAVESPWVDVIHARINPYGIAMDHSDPSEVIQVIQQLHESGKGVIGMKLIGEGRYQDDSNKINHALKFVLGLDCVDTMIVGFQTRQQIDNYAARIRNTLKSMMDS